MLPGLSENNFDEENITQKALQCLEITHEGDPSKAEDMTEKRMHASLPPFLQ